MDKALDNENMIDCIFDDFAKELDKADEKYGPMPGIKDGLHTLMIEVAELRREVETENFNPLALRKEAIQVGAMATKFMRDVVAHLIAEIDDVENTAA